MQHILGSPDTMLRTVFHHIDGMGLPRLQCDHICYRVETNDRYKELKEALLTVASLESEVPISGRLISTFKLHAPCLFEGQEIECVELPAPSKTTYPEGWEHAEFVTGEPLEAFMARYPLMFNTRHLGKAHNPEIKLAVPGGFSAKFHPKSLLDVIAEENRLGIVPR